MNMQDMLKTLYKLDEAGTNAADPNGGMWADNYPENSSSDKYDITKPQAGSSGQAAPTMQQTANTMDTQGGQQAAQNDPKKLDLLKKLNDVITQLWQLNQSSIESGKYESYRSDIAKALMESFNIFEEPAQLSASGQRAKLVADANEIAKQLEPYKSQPDVAQALQKLQQASAAPKEVAPMGPVGDDKVKRFQELMGKLQSAAKAPAPKPAAPTPAGQKPASTGGSAGQPSAQDANKEALNSPENIKGLQNALKMAGATNLKIDGIYGKDTKTAAQKYQEVAKQYLAGASDKPSSSAQPASSGAQPAAQPGTRQGHGRGSF